MDSEPTPAGEGLKKSVSEQYNIFFQTVISVVYFYGMIQVLSVEAFT